VEILFDMVLQHAQHKKTETIGGLSEPMEHKNLLYKKRVHPSKPFSLLGPWWGV